MYVLEFEQMLWVELTSACWAAVLGCVGVSYPSLMRLPSSADAFHHDFGRLQLGRIEISN